MKNVAQFKNIRESKNTILLSKNFSIKTIFIILYINMHNEM